MAFGIKKEAVSPMSELPEWMILALHRTGDRCMLCIVCNRDQPEEYCPRRMEAPVCCKCFPDSDFPVQFLTSHGCRLEGTDAYLPIKKALTESKSAPMSCQATGCRMASP